MSAEAIESIRVSHSPQPSQRARPGRHAHLHVPSEGSGPLTCLCLSDLVPVLLYFEKILLLRRSLVPREPASFLDQGPSVLVNLDQA